MTLFPEIDVQLKVIYARKLVIADRSYDYWS